MKKTARKNIIKRIVDLLLTLLLLLLMAYQVTGEALHEWLGIAMTAVLIVHHVLNYRWYRALFRGRYNAYRIVTVLVNTLLLAAIALTALCGMSMSNNAVPFLYSTLRIIFARQFHLAMSFWSFILMGLHLGLHVPVLTAGWKLNGKAKLILTAAFVGIAGAGLWRFLKNGITDYIFFRMPFAVLDYEKAAVLVFLENLVILIFFAFLGAGAALLTKAWGKRKTVRSQEMQH